MKKLFLFMISAVIVFAGCAQKAAVKNTPEPQAPAAQQKSAPAATQQASPDTSKVKEIPVQKVTEKQLSDAERIIRESQTKLQDIHFDFDKYTIRDDAKPVLKQVSEYMLKEKALLVSIEGHCDEKGTNEYNLALGDRRANAAKNYLVSLGIPSSRTETISYGEERPLCTDHTEACWAKNRRDHFVLFEKK